MIDTLIFYVPLSLVLGFTGGLLTSFVASRIDEEKYCDFMERLADPIAEFLWNHCVYDGPGRARRRKARQERQVQPQ